MKATSLLAEGTRRLGAAGVENPAGDARLILLHAAGWTRNDLAVDPERPVGKIAANTFLSLVDRRAAREPLSHLTGRRGFWTLDFEVGRDVLDPRPDSESLIEAALDLFPAQDAAIRVLDLGVGSGCLLLSVLAERPHATGIGVDLSPGALAVARVNAEASGLSSRAEFAIGSWGQGIDGQFDLVLCNPPYIESGAIDALAPEVSRYEPVLALDGGPDGLDAYRAVAPDIFRLLAPGGAAVVEAGAGQMDEIANLFACAGLCERERRTDLGGIPRAGVFVHAVGESAA